MRFTIVASALALSVHSNASAAFEEKPLAKGESIRVEIVSFIVPNAIAAPIIDSYDGSEVLIKNSDGADGLERLAIIYDGEVIAAPTLMEPISGGALAFTNDFGKDRSEYFAEQLQPK